MGGWYGGIAGAAGLAFNVLADPFCKAKRSTYVTEEKEKNRSRLK